MLPVKPYDNVVGVEATVAAWLAGLIDGEGSIMLSRRTHSGNTQATTQRGQTHYRPVITIATTDYRLMSALQYRVGCGQIYEHRVSNTAKSHNPRKRRQWTWRLNVSQIEQVLPPVRPWLVLKDEQASLLLEAIKLKQEFSCRKGEKWDAPRLLGIRERLAEIYVSIRAANTRGREVDNQEGVVI